MFFPLTLILYVFLYLHSEIVYTSFFRKFDAYADLLLDCTRWICNVTSNEIRIFHLITQSLFILFNFFFSSWGKIAWNNHLGEFFFAAAVVLAIWWIERLTTVALIGTHKRSTMMIVMVTVSSHAAIALWYYAVGTATCGRTVPTMICW